MIKAEAAPNLLPGIHCVTVRLCCPIIIVIYLQQLGSHTLAARLTVHHYKSSLARTLHSRFSGSTGFLCRTEKET